MSSRKRTIIYVDGEPYPDEEDEIKPPEHALVEDTVDAMGVFTDFMVKPAENIGKAFKYLLKAITFSG
ncbi:MAG: hypothetical protein JZD41_07865 [Thermoproteus sp.]|nr:hypothetical protein [Thermoproteus sp.]